MQTRYDLHTAVTFLLAGVGVGAVLALIFAPLHSNTPIPRNRRAGGRLAESALSSAV